MMKISIALQTVVFLNAVLLGAALGIIYDALRAVRRAAGAGVGITAICDAIFWIITLLTLFLFVLTIANGEGRGYIILGGVLGGIFYFLTCSQLVLAICGFLAQSCGKIGNNIRILSKNARAALVPPEKSDKSYKKIEKNSKSSFLFSRIGLKYKR